MSVPQTVAEVLRNHVTLEVEGIDRMYLNVYVPQLQRELGVVGFLRYHLGHRFASSAMLAPISDAFRKSIETFAKAHDIPLFPFAKGQRKDDVAAEHLREFASQEGVLFVGKAQEKTPVFRTEKRRNPETGYTYPWIVRSTAMVNHYYFYCVDEDFGPFFLKFCSYFPYNAKLCINGHEYVKRQLEKHDITYEALDNGVLSCEDPCAAPGTVRWALGREDRRSASQMAGEVAAPLHRRGPAGRLSLRPVDSAIRVFADAGSGPSAVRPHLLRRDDS